MRGHHHVSFRRTGDIAEVSGDPPYFTLLGRASADIIKAAGYKISALGIENVIAAHPHVREVAVLGLPHSTLGEEITAVVACRKPHQVDKWNAAVVVETQRSCTWRHYLYIYVYCCTCISNRGIQR